MYDAKTGRLEVIEAKKMVVRGQVRAKQATDSHKDEREARQVSADYFRVFLTAHVTDCCFRA